MRRHIEITYATITTGCTPSPDYTMKIGVVLTKKGVFGIPVYNDNIQNCFTNYATNAQLRLALNINDPHKLFYQQLPFADIGKTEDNNVLQQIDSKTTAIIDVQ